MPTERPRVSIVTPVYNAERFIGACVRSVLDQTFDDWEQIIVDDGSSDATGDIARGFDDPRVRYIGLPHRGLSALAETYNTALQVARGELIAASGWGKSKTVIQNWFVGAILVHRINQGYTLEGLSGAAWGHWQAYTLAVIEVTFWFVVVLTVVSLLDYLYSHRGLWTGQAA